jgi:hypothetical protein
VAHRHLEALRTLTVVVLLCLGAPLRAEQVRPILVQVRIDGSANALRQDLRSELAQIGHASQTPESFLTHVVAKEMSASLPLFQFIETPAPATAGLLTVTLKSRSTVPWPTGELVMRIDVNGAGFELPVTALNDVSAHHYELCDNPSWLTDAIGQSLGAWQEMGSLFLGIAIPSRVMRVDDGTPHVVVTLTYDDFPDGALNPIWWYPSALFEVTVGGTAYRFPSCWIDAAHHIAGPSSTDRVDWDNRRRKTACIDRAPASTQPMQPGRIHLVRYWQ